MTSKFKATNHVTTCLTCCIAIGFNLFLTKLLNLVWICFSTIFIHIKKKKKKVF